MAAREQWTMAAALADNVRQKYPEVRSVANEAAQIVGKAAVEAQRDIAEKKEKAEDLIKEADIFYNQATQAFNNLFDKERSNLPALSSSRSEATRYYQLALSTYEKVIELDPSRGESPSVVTERIRECRERIRSLNRRPEPFNIRID